MDDNEAEDPLKPEYPPGLFVEESAPVILPPTPPETPEPPTRSVPVQAAAEPVPLAPTVGKRSHRLLIVCVIIVVVLAVAVSLLMVFQPWRSTPQITQDFNDAVSRYETSQQALTQKIADAEDLKSIDAQVSDPAVMDRLSSALDDAQSKVASAPAMAESRRQIENQTSQLTNQTQTCDDVAASLDQAMQAVSSGRIQYATDALNEAIASAQAVLDQSHSTGDQSARSALAIAIQRTKTIVSGLATADPASFAATISEQQSSLQQASQAVLGDQPMTCDNGVTVPVGINPMVCQSMPRTAIQTVVSGAAVASTTQFSMPSGNVGCTRNPYDTGMICEIIRKDWTLPSNLVPACPAGNSCGEPIAAIEDGNVTAVIRGDAPWANDINNSAVTVPVLAYGQVADLSPVACLSDEDGVICWDTSTHHGFQMSVIVFTYW